MTILTDEDPFKAFKRVIAQSGPTDKAYILFVRNRNS